MRLSDYFNEKAAIWDSTVAEKDTRKLKTLAAQIGLKKDNVVLDVGTGTGVFLPYILDYVGAGGMIYALDIAEKMLEKAAQKYPGKNIQFIRAGVEDIPLPDAYCDVVICYSSFPHFTDKPRALQEMKRVLKPGGIFFIGHTSGRHHINEIHRQIEAAKNDLLPGAIEMHRLMKTAGFTGIRVEDETGSYRALATKPVNALL